MMSNSIISQKMAGIALFSSGGVLLIGIGKLSTKYAKKAHSRFGVMIPLAIPLFMIIGGFDIMVCKNCKLP